MAVEIRELVIKAIIVADRDDDHASPGTSSPAGKDQIVQECVNQVLKIIRKGENR